MEPTQAALLERVCAGATLSEATLRAAGAFETPAPETTATARPPAPDEPELFGQ